MEEQKLARYQVPMEWVNRIFLRFAEIYGDIFLSKFATSHRLDISKEQWRRGLYGLTPDEIKRVLDLCRANIITMPPNVIEFYHIAKGYRSVQSKTPANELSPESKQIGSQYLSLLRAKIYGKLGSDGEATLATLDKQILDKQTRKESTHWQNG